MEFDGLSAIMDLASPISTKARFFSASGEQIHLGRITLILGWGYL